MSVLIQIFLFLNFVFSNGQENINITRKPSSISLDYPDRFYLPPLFCGKSKGVTECPLMGGRKIADCQCVCDFKDDRNVTYKSTFGFYGGKWKCENNTVVRKHAGCLLLEEQSNYLIRTNSSFMLSLMNLQPRFNNSCKIERVLAGSSTYLDCDGKWAPLKGVNVSKRFNLTFNNTFRFVSQSLDPFLNGLVIRLAVECSEHYSMQCLLLKVQGHQICTLPPPTVATSKWKTTTPDPTSDSTFRVILIVGSLVIMAVLFIIVIVVNLTIKSRCRRRKRYIKYKENKSKSKRKPKTNEAKDCGYVYPDEKHPGGGEEYSSNNGCLLQDRRQDNRELIGGNPTAPNYVNVDAVVNDSSAPKTSESIVSTELSYENLPEEQNDVPKITKKRDDLGTSKSVVGNDPHVYGSLLGNDPHVYGSLNVPHKKPEDVDKQVTSTLPNKEDTYQQLNPIGQQSDGEYQALECKPERPN